MSMSNTGPIHDSLLSTFEPGEIIVSRHTASAFVDTDNVYHAVKHRVYAQVVKVLGGGMYDVLVALPDGRFVTCRDCPAGQFVEGYDICDEHAGDADYTCRACASDPMAEEVAEAAYQCAMCGGVFTMADDDSEVVCDCGLCMLEEN